MQTDSSRIWTRVAESISYDDNHYTMGTSSPFNNSLVTVPKAPITICIILTFMFHSFFQFSSKVEIFILLIYPYIGCQATLKSWDTTKQSVYGWRYIYIYIYIYIICKESESLKKKKKLMPRKKLRWTKEKKKLSTNPINTEKVLNTYVEHF